MRVVPCAWLAIGCGLAPALSTHCVIASTASFLRRASLAGFKSLFARFVGAALAQGAPVSNQPQHGAGAGTLRVSLARS
jgi:hypothetical protein